eukprot:6241343-Prymnesium_polylepis.4
MAEEQEDRLAISARALVHRLARMLQNLAPVAQRPQAEITERDREIAALDRVCATQLIQMQCVLAPVEPSRPRLRGGRHIKELDATRGAVRASNAFEHAPQSLCAIVLAVVASLRCTVDRLALCVLRQLQKLLGVPFGFSLIDTIIHGDNMIKFQLADMQRRKTLALKFHANGRVEAVARWCHAIVHQLHRVGEEPFLLGLCLHHIWVQPGQDVCVA